MRRNFQIGTVNTLRNAAVLFLLACAGVRGWSAPVAEIAGSSFGQIQADNDLLHVVVGHSVFLNTKNRLKRVYISNPNVLGAFTASPNEVLVTAKAAGSSTLVAWDESGQSSAYSVSADLDVEGLRNDLKRALPGAQLAVAALQDRIQLSGSVQNQAEYDAAVKLAQVYAKDIANSMVVEAPRTKQVELKVQFVEVDRVKLAQFGINLFTGGKNTSEVSTQQFNSFGSFSVGKNSTGGNSTELTISNPLNFFLYNQQYNVALAISDLEQKQVLQILAEPTITSLSGEEASFLAGGEFPFPVVQGGSGNFVSVTVQFRPYGVKLLFTPTVNPDGTIRLKVAPEVSALDYTNEVQISGYNIPAISTRRAQTDVELRSGQSFAISGLLDHRLTDAFSSTPGIASVPILGQLFRSKNKNLSVAELVVIVTPTIVDPLSAPANAPTPKPAKPYLDVDQFDHQMNGKLKK